MSSDSDDFGYAGLPGNILNQIFRLFPLAERIKLRQVCRKWQEEMTFADIDVLEMGWVANRRSRFDSTNVKVMLALKFLLPRIGANLRVLSFGKATVTLNEATLKLIAQSCPFLVELTGEATRLSIGQASVLTRLQRLTCSSFWDTSSEEPLLASAAAACNQLTSLKLLDFADRYNDPFLVHLRGKALKVLKFDVISRDFHAHPLDQDSFRTLCENCPSIASLRLVCSTINSLQPLTKLVALRELELIQCQDITESTLDPDVLSALTSLSLKYCDAINRFDFLRNMDDLITLNLAGTKVSSAEHMINLSVLENLDLTDCNRFYDASSLLRMAFECPKVTDLRLSGTNVQYLTFLIPWSNLQCLDIDDLSAISASDLVSLHPYAPLEQLYMRKLTPTDELLTLLIQRRYPLKQICFGTGHITGYLFQEFLLASPDLEHMEAGCMSGYSAKVLPILFKMTHLDRVDLNLSCLKIEDIKRSLEKRAKARTEEDGKSKLPHVTVGLVNYISSDAYEDPSKTTAVIPKELCKYADIDFA